MDSLKSASAQKDDERAALEQQLVLKDKCIGEISWELKQEKAVWKKWLFQHQHLENDLTLIVKDVETRLSDAVTYLQLQWSADRERQRILLVSMQSAHESKPRTSL